MDKSAKIVRADLRCGAVMDITLNRNVLEHWWKERYNYLYHISDVEIRFESKKHEDDFYSEFEYYIISIIEDDCCAVRDLQIEFEEYVDNQLSSIYPGDNNKQLRFPKSVWVEILYERCYLDDDDRETLSELAPGHFCIDITDKKE
jgi:hypothetical protein